MKLKLTFLLTVLMSMVGTKAYATFIVNNDDGIAITYGEIDRNTVEIYSCHAIGNVVIPKTISHNGNTYTVTRIHYSAFYGHEACTVSLPKTITSIMYSAFASCKGLTSITMPGVESIGDGAFSNCSKLTSITIPSSVTFIGSAPFSGCTSLTTVIIESNTIASENRNDNFSLGNIFGKQVTEYILGDEITEIGEYAFNGCSALSSITLSKNIKEIKKYSFGGCKELKTLEIPNNVVAIGDNAFKGCSSLESIRLSNNLNKIGGNAFYGCGELSSIEIPNGITSIGTNAFEGCDKLKKVITRDLNAWHKIDFNNAKANPLAIAHHLYQDENTEITELEIPEGIGSIGKYSFYGATNIKSCTFPKDINEIPISAFEGCSSLITLNLGEGTTIINERAFYGCSSIQALEIPNSVTSIGASAFGESNINSLYIGTGVTSIGQNAFGSNRPTKTFWFTNIPPTGYTSARGEINYVANEQYKSLTNQTVYPYLNSYFIVDGVKYVPVNPSARTCDIIDGSYDSAVETIDVHSSVMYRNIPMTVKNLNSYAFYNNRNVKNVNLEFDGTISSRAFQNCINLQELNIEISGAIETYSFNNCMALKNVNISKSKGINESSFYQSGIDGVLNISNTREIGIAAFRGVIGDFKAVIATNSIIGTYAFSNCTGLQEVILGDEVTGLDDNVFYGCTALDSITIGAQVKNIGKEAFYDCQKISKIISRAITPPVCNTNALDNINKWTCTLSVPKGCTAVYQAADQWKEFFYIEEHDSGETESKRCAIPTIIYNHGKLVFESETEGAVCQYTIADNDIKSDIANEVNLSVTYNISVYATKAGYDNSDVATATLCWVDQQPTSEGLTNSFVNVPAKAFLIQSDGGTISIQGCDEGEQVSVFGVNGTQVGTAVSQNGFATINTSLQSGSVAIVKIGTKSVKVVVK